MAAGIVSADRTTDVQHDAARRSACLSLSLCLSRLPPKLKPQPYLELEPKLELRGRRRRVLRMGRPGGKSRDSDLAIWRFRLPAPGYQTRLVLSTMRCDGRPACLWYSCLPHQAGSQVLD